LSLFEGEQKQTVFVCPFKCKWASHTAENFKNLSFYVQTGVSQRWI